MPLRDQALLASLPIEARLALAYARGRARPVLLGLLALDSRLAGVARSASEPVLGQVRLAWWRDQLNLPPEQRATGEPLLAALAEWGESGARLIALVDGWEAVLLDPSARAALALAASRARAFVAAAEVLGVPHADGEAERAACNWTLADLASKSGSGEVHSAMLALAAAQDWSRPALPRALRPLAVLHGLARRDRGERPLLRGISSVAVAMRLGLFGR